MNARIIIALPLLFASLTSCDKIKSQLNKASLKKSEIKEDPELQKLVDQTAEGVIFRKDLPFPQKIEVKSTRSTELATRNMQASAIDTHSEAVKGVQTTIRKLSLANNQVIHTLEESSFIIPSQDPQQAAADATKRATPGKQAGPANKPSTFQLTGKTWKADSSGDFKSVVLAKELSPVFEDLLLENALAPRPLWFSKKRIKLGDSQVIAGNSLAMLFSGKIKGSVTLKLESFATVEGHPCGVFSITGTYSRKKFPNFEAIFTDEDVSIQSGKVWLSLIYPILLRQELDTIQSVTTGDLGGLVTRSQGSAKVSQIYSWKSLKP